MPRPGGKDRGIFERYKGSGVWYVRFFDEFGQEHKQAVGPKSLAKKVYEDRRRAVRIGTFSPDDRVKVTISKVMDAYKKYEDRTGHHIMDTPKGHERIKARFGKWPYDRITRVHVEEFAEELTAGLGKEADGTPLTPMAASTVNHHIALLSAAMRRAFRAGMIKSNPLTDLSKLKENNKRDRWATTDEEKRLMDALPARVHAVILTSIHGGLRKGELKALRCRDIDLVGRMLHVREAKGGEGRSIPLNDVLFAALSTIQGEPGELVFRGNTLTNLRDIWDQAVKDAKLDNFKFHDLRHTFASRLVMAGVDLRRVQILMGHKSIKMTERYAHLAPGHLRDAVSRLVLKPGEADPWSHGSTV